MHPATHPPLLTRDTSDHPANFTLAGIPEIPFYGRQFQVVMHTCRNAICECGTIELFLYMPERLGSNDYSFRIHGDALERRFDLQDSAENSGRAARMLDLYLTPADWVSIEQEWRLTKAMLIEHLDPKHLACSVQFPADIRRDPSNLIAFSTIFPLSYPHRATLGKEELELLDGYCSNPTCPCTQSMFSFATPEKHFFSFWYDYRQRKIELPADSQGKISVAEAAQLVEHLNVRYQGFDQSIENRHRVLRALYAKDLKKRPLPRPVLAGIPASRPFLPLAAVVGRNDPCPCGSGNKYKRCCGR